MHLTVFSQGRYFFFIKQDCNGLVITFLSCRDRMLQWPKNQLPRGAGCDQCCHAVLGSPPICSSHADVLPILINVNQQRETAELLFCRLVNTGPDQDSLDPCLLEVALHRGALLPSRTRNTCVERHPIAVKCYLGFQLHDSN